MLLTTHSVSAGCGATVKGGAFVPIGSLTHDTFCEATRVLRGEANFPLYPRLS